MKILLATDGSDYSNLAINEIANRPFPAKTKVQIVSAYNSARLIVGMEPMGLLQQYYLETDKVNKKFAEDTVENAAKILRKKNPELKVTTKAIKGDAKNVILEESEKFKANLIVIGSHGYGAINRFLMGSVSQAVSMHAKCSVEIVRK